MSKGALTICLDAAGEALSSEAFARRLPNATFLRIEGARHEILNERDEYRDQFLAAFDRQAKAWLPEENTVDR